VNLRALLRILFLSLAIFLIVWSVCSSHFYDSEGALTGEFALPFSGGISLLLLSVFSSRVGFWAAMALTAQAVLLQLIDAGKRLHYQHYRLDESFGLLSLILLQAVLVLSGLWRYRITIGRWIRKQGRPLLIGSILIASISAAVSESVSFFIREFLFGFFVCVVQIGNIFLIVHEIRPGYFLRRFHGLISNENPPSPDRFAIVAAIWVTLIGIVLSIFVYERHPHVNDEVAYLYQARILAQGALTIEAPPVPKAFDVYLLEYTNGRMFVVPPPGWPALLAIGVLLKIPWLVNPLLAGVNILLAYFVLTHLYNRAIARLSILLLCVSPWYLFMSMNFMTHHWTTACALICTAGVIQARRTNQAGWAFLSGIFLGIQSLIRPVDALILGVLVGIWSIGFGGRRLKLASLFAFAIGTILTGSLIFPYNRYFTGDALTYPINVYNEALFGKNANAYGFGKDHGMGWPLDPLPGHGPVAALINAQLNTSQINIELFGWSTGCLWFIVLLILCRGGQRRDFTPIAVLVAVFTGYFFYYFSGGPDFGARYWFMMIIPLAALTARGIQWLQLRINPHGIQVFTAILILSCFALANYFPWRATDKYHHYLGMRPEVCSIVRTESPAGDLVLIQGERFPDYASAMVCNPLNFRRGNPIFVWDRGPDTRELIREHYSGRTLWVVRGPSLTGRGYELAK
jgi:hypothetical protein